MQIIKVISSQIEDEIKGVKEYAQLALKYKEEHPELADTYHKLGEDEMGHVNKLHDAVAALIKEYRAKNGEPPANMLAVYEYLHGRHIEAAAEARSILDMYNR